MQIIILLSDLHMNIWFYGWSNQHKFPLVYCHVFHRFPKMSKGPTCKLRQSCQALTAWPAREPRSLASSTFWQTRQCFCSEFLALLLFQGVSGWWYSSNILYGMWFPGIFWCFPVWLRCYEVCRLFLLLFHVMSHDASRTDASCKTMAVYPTAPRQEIWWCLSECVWRRIDEISNDDSCNRLSGSCRFFGGLTPFDSSLELSFLQKWSTLLCRERKIFLREVKTQRYLDQPSNMAPGRLVWHGAWHLERALNLYIPIISHQGIQCDGLFPIAWFGNEIVRGKTENYFVFHWYWKHSSSLLWDLVTFGQKKLTSSFLEQSLVAQSCSIRNEVFIFDHFDHFQRSMERHPCQWSEVFVSGTAPAQRQSCHVSGSDSQQKYWSTDSEHEHYIIYIYDIICDIIQNDLRS